MTISKIIPINSRVAGADDTGRNEASHSSQRKKKPEQGRPPLDKMSNDFMNSLTLSTQISILLFIPLLAAAILTFFSAVISSRSTRKNAQAQNEIATKNAKAQNDLAARMKLADFRQAWINELRSCFAELQSRGMLHTASDAEIIELTRLTQKVRLLMNNSDASYPQLDTLMDQLVTNNDIGERYKVILAMTPLSQKLLKDEWEVLKRDLNYKPSAGGSA